jgi:short-subunit dehydrogenase
MADFARLMDVSGRSALVTGATGGLGQAIARALAARGVRLILSGRRADLLEELATELGARAVPADLSQPGDVQHLISETADIDVLVANAGLPGSGLLESFSVEEIDRSIAVNLRAPIVMARALVGPMTSRGEGHMVFVSSLSGKSATPGSSIYNATKFGLRGFGLALHAELHGTGVGVSVVNPGFIREAGMFAESGAKLPPGVGTRTPEDVARAVLRAIERNRAEINVAPAPLRAGATFGGMAPGLAEAVSRRMGADKLSRDIAGGQRDQR